LTVERPYDVMLASLREQLELVTQVIQIFETLQGMRHRYRVPGKRRGRPPGSYGKKRREAIAAAAAAAQSSPGES
jgi:hypothetical protein